jgi:putative CocE/NonD family hydrolase
LLETVEDKPNGVLNATTFPLENTRWTDLYLRAEGKLDSAQPRKNEGSDVYFTGSPRQAWSYQAGHTAGSPFTTAEGPDELTYATEKFKQPTAMIGPSTATLFVSSTTPDTELFVQIIDEGPDGSRYYLQRGMLRASHRAITLGLSDFDGDVMYRPHRPHTNPTFIEPERVYRYLVEVFPFGHVFRPGHRLVVKIHTPPIVDSYYAYVPRRFVGVNTVLHDAEHPSHLTLPFVSLGGVQLGPEPKPCTQTAIRCVGG